MGFTFEQLDAYQKASAFAKEVMRFTNNVPPREYDLADQLRRAAISIPANIVEGWGRWHFKEKKHFYGIAMGSTNECVPLLEFALFNAMISQDQHVQLKQLLCEIAQLINGLVRAAIKAEARRTKTEDRRT